MFIETENTPNPATLKFRPGCRVTGDGLTADFASAEAAQGRSTLVEALFAIDGVTGVFLGADFISVTKSELSEWAALKPAILTEIASALSHGTPVLLSKGEERAYEVAEQDREVVARIRELLDTRVRRPWRGTAVTLCSAAIRMVWCDFPCRVPAPGARHPVRHSSTALRICCAITCRRSKRLNKWRCRDESSGRG